MKTHPVILSTSAGPVGAVVTLPRGEVKGVAVTLPGWNSTRAGINQVWARLAVSLSSIGVGAVRFDYPGTGESHACQLDRWMEGTTEVIEWVRRRLGHERLLLVAECGGVVPAHFQVTRYPDGVAAVAHVLPAVTVPGEAPRLPRVFRITDNTTWPRDVLEAGSRSNDMLVEIGQAVPLWVLAAPDDPATGLLAALLPALRAGVGFELEVAPPATKGPSHWPGEQEVVNCATAWAARHIGPVASVFSDQSEEG